MPRQRRNAYIGILAKTTGNLRRNTEEKGLKTSCTRLTSLLKNKNKRQSNNIIMTTSIIIELMTIKING